MLNTDNFDQALEWAERGVASAQSPPRMCEALIGRVLVRDFGGHPALALPDHRAATAIARELGASTLTAALVFHAQSLIVTGALEEALELLQEAERVGRPARARTLMYLDTQYADLAAAAGRPADALERYARSLERGQARGQGLQILFDLRGMANALGALGHDDDALEVLGLAEAQALDIGERSDLARQLQGDASAVAAQERVGEARSAELRAQGHAVPAAMRVARAVSLARSGPDGVRGPMDAERSSAL